MPKSNKRSRTFRRIYSRSPSGISRLVYRRRKPSKNHCSNCGQELHGTAYDLPIRLKNLPQTYKVPSRPFAGNLCSFCSREKIKGMIRK